MLNNLPFLTITVFTLTLNTLTPVHASDEWKRFPEKWEFVCNKDQFHYKQKNPMTTELLTEHLKTLTIEAYLEGFERLLKINPGFTSKLLGNIETEPLIVNCESLKGPFAETVFVPLVPTKISISTAVLTVYISSIETNQGLRKALEKETDQDNIDHFRSLIRPDQGSKQVVVHELLHFMQADNVSRLDHNNPRKFDPNDLVFACASAAIKSAINKPSNEKTKSCEICARARIVNGRNIVSQEAADIKEAKKTCADLI